MEKVPMCRICLTDNVRMYIVVNRNLHELYEKLTNIPFVTEDSRPILACFFCCAKLKQCYRLLRQCQEAEELFAQRMKEDYEPNPLVNQDHLKFCNGFIKSPIVLTSIVDECRTESIAIKEEFPTVCEGLDDVIEPKEERESDGELVPGNLDEICQDVADIPPRHSEPDLEDYDSLMEFKVEVEEEEASKKEGRGTDTQRTPDAKLEDAGTAEQTKKGNSQGIRISQKRTSDRGTYLKEPYKYDMRNINQVKNIIHHTRKQNGENHKCDACKLSFTSKSHFTEHIRCFHSEEKPHKCIGCLQSFGTQSLLMLHTCINSGENPYKCDGCQRSFSAEGHLLSHIRTHAVDKPHKCNVCQRSFNNKGTLLSHIRIHVDKPHKCDVCQRGFHYKGLLSNHLRIHIGEKPYKCDVCQRTFSAEGQLLSHIRTHAAAKLHKCDVCHRSFSNKGTLLSHIRIHAVDKPHKCDVCQRSFSNKGTLLSHIRIHAVDKPHKCDVCQRSFHYIGPLSNHIRIHTGEKPCKCDVCQRGFSA